MAELEATDEEPHLQWHAAAFRLFEVVIMIFEAAPEVIRGHTLEKVRGLFSIRCQEMCSRYL